jgi:hypothetical protein
MMAAHNSVTRLLAAGPPMQLSDPMSVTMYNTATALLHQIDFAMAMRKGEVGQAPVMDVYGNVMVPQQSFGGHPSQAGMAQMANNAQPTYAGAHYTAAEMLQNVLQQDVQRRHEHRVEQAAAPGTPYSGGVPLPDAGHPGAHPEKGAQVCSRESTEMCCCKYHSCSIAHLHLTAVRRVWALCPSACRLTLHMCTLAQPLVCHTHRREPFSLSQSAMSMQMTVHTLLDLTARRQQVEMRLLAI